jgi:hypothetical protein
MMPIYTNGAINHNLLHFKGFGKMTMWESARTDRGMRDEISNVSLIHGLQGQLFDDPEISLAHKPS